MSKIQVDQVEPSSFDMTPMIDCVFQLLIFFMLATDMSQKELEALIPPTAKFAEEVKTEQVSTRLVANIVHEGLDKITCAAWQEMMVLDNSGRRAEILKNPFRCLKPEHWLIRIRKVNYKTPKDLVLRLKEEADLEREKDRIGNIYPSKRVIMIRADFRAPFAMIEAVMRACGDPQVAMYKLEFGAMMPLPE